MRDESCSKVDKKNVHEAKYTERFKALFNYASIGILLADAEGYIIMINNFALKQFGYSQIEIKGKKVEILINPIR